jgi:hypothetical protein
MGSTNYIFNIRGRFVPNENPRRHHAALYYITELGRLHQYWQLVYPGKHIDDVKDTCMVSSFHLNTWLTPGITRILLFKFKGCLEISKRRVKYNSTWPWLLSKNAVMITTERTGIKKTLFVKLISWFFTSWSWFINEKLHNCISHDHTYTDIDLCFFSLD